MSTSTELTLRTMSLLEIERYIAYVWMPRAAAVMIESPPGFGKTTMGLNLSRKTQARYHNFGSTYMNVGGADTTDVLGMPILTDPEYPLTVNGMPLWLQPDVSRGLRGAFPTLCPDHLRDAPDASTKPSSDLLVQYASKTLTREALVPYERGILNIDEAGSTQDKTVQQPLSRIANDAAINSWYVPNTGWCKLFYTNSAEDGAGATDLLTHLGNRVRQVKLKPDAADYLTYWAGDTLHVHAHRDVEGRLAYTPQPMRPEFRYYAGWMQSTVFDERACHRAMEAGTSLFCSPRSYEAAALDVEMFARTALQLDPADDIPLDNKQIMQLVACAVGDGVAHEFAGYMPHYSGRVRVEDILSDPKGLPIPEVGVAMSIFIDTMVDCINPMVPEQMRAAKILLCRDQFPKLYSGRWCTMFADRYGFTSVLESEHYNAIMNHSGRAATTPLLVGKMGLV